MHLSSFPPGSFCMSRFLSYSLVFTAAIFVGLYSTFFYSSVMDPINPGDAPNQIAKPATVTVTAFEQIPPVEPVPNFPEDNCGVWHDEPDERALIREWLKGGRIKDVPYCSSTAREASGFNPSNLHPKLVDFNADGVDELAIRTLCSPTGNCSMTVYQRSKRGYRTIFTDIH